MEEIPYDIQQKIKKLHVYSFDNAEDLQKTIVSNDFNDIFTFYKENYLPDIVKNKPEIEQRLSLYLAITNQDQEFINQTDQVLYRRPCPDIHTFLTDKFYMGYNNATLYPYWKEKLEEIFKENSPIRKTIFSGCIGCLTKDTVISTLNGEKTIEELLNNFDNEWVLSYNTANNSWEPDKILDVFYTGNRDVYRITLDNGEIIKCTNNHKFLSRKNKWVSIKDKTLVPGLSMMPYYTRFNKKGYTQVKDNKTERWKSRYVIVGKWKSEYHKGIAIHHKNYNKLDDRPQNLCLLTVSEHYMFHAKKGGEQWKKYAERISGDEFKEYQSLRSKKGKETYKKRTDYEELEKIRKRGWNKLLHDSERQSKIAKETWKNSYEKMKELAKISITNRNKSEKARETSKRMAENMRKIKANKTKEELAIIYVKQGLSSLKRHKGINSKEYKERLEFIRQYEPWYDPELGAKENHRRKKLYNHKVVSIEYIGKEDVYDITTEKNHNFALKAGIIAHNSGKSTIARKAFIYVLYRALCLRYPRAVFNIDQDSTIANIVISMTLKQVFDTNLLPFVKLMETMPCFQRVLSTRAFENFDLENDKCPIPFQVEKSTGTIFFPDNIILTCGSNQGHFTGYNVINSFCDEINEKGVEEAIALLNTLDNRFSSRFEGSDFVFQSVVSSARTKNSALGEYIRHLPKNDPSILKLTPCLWEIKPDPNFIGDGTTFPVMVGNGSIPSKIITDPGELKAIDEDKYEPPAGCELIHVPTNFKSKFELQLDQSIQDIAGITTDDNNSVFRDTTRLEDPLLLPEIQLEVNLRENTNILDIIEQYNLFEQDINGRWRFKRAPNALRYIHNDLSAGGDEQCDSSLCIVHKEYKINEITKQKDIIYVVDLLLFINAKNKIDLHAIQNFLIDLVTEKNIQIHTVSSDQWNGEIFLQALDASGCFTEVKKVSVDSKLEPYMNYVNLIESGFVKIGPCPKLKKELESLIFYKGKVTRTTELKDGADSSCGAIYNAQMNYNDIPTYEYIEKIKNKEYNYNDYINENEELVDLI